VDLGACSQRHFRLQPIVLCALYRLREVYIMAICLMGRTNRSAEPLNEVLRHQLRFCLRLSGMLGIRLAGSHARVVAHMLSELSRFDSARAFSLGSCRPGNWRS